MMLDSNKVRREILRLYDREPQEWNVSVGKDKVGFYDFLISHKSRAWQVKEYQVNPYNFVGLGTRLPNVPINRLGKDEHTFGLRPIDLDQMRELASMIDDPQAMNSLASRLLRETPISTQEALENPAVLHGPILHSNSPMETLSTAHAKLDEKLRKELQHIISRDYRHTLTPYI
jgi:hypothetical protein